MLPVCDRTVHVGVALALELKSHKKTYRVYNGLSCVLALLDSTGNILVAISSMLVAVAVAFASTFSRPICELSDEEMRIATTGQGHDVIE